MSGVIRLFISAAFLLLVTAAVWGVWRIAALIFAKRRKRALLLGVPVAVVIVGVATTVMMWRSTDPATLFQDEFGFAPPADVTFVQSHSYILGDSGAIYLQFHAAPLTITRIRASIGLTSGNPNFSTNARPAWFTPPTNAQCYYLDKPATKSGSFRSEMRILKVDPIHQEAWFEFSGVD